MNAMNLYPFVLPEHPLRTLPLFTLVVNCPPALPVWLLFGDLHIPSIDFAGPTVVVTREHSEGGSGHFKAETLPVPLGFFKQLNQWFSIKDDFPPKEHLTMSGDFLVVTPGTVGVGLLLASSG